MFKYVVNEAIDRKIYFTFEADLKPIKIDISVKFIWTQEIF